MRTMIGGTEDILPVWDRVEDIFPKYLAELDNFLRVTAWTEPAAPAGKGEQVFVMAVRAADSCEALFQITAFEVGPNNLGDNRAIKAIIAGKPIVIYLFKPVEMIQKQPIQR